MKYSLGITNSKKKNTRKKTTASKGTSSASRMTKHRNVRKYSSKRTGKNNKLSIKNMWDFSDKNFKTKAKKILYISIGALFLLGCIGLIGVGIYLKSLQGSLPSPDELVQRSSDQSTQIFDRNGELLYTVYGDQNREFVSIDDIPEQTKWALLAAEDIEFYQHKGLDYKGIAVALLRNLRAGGITGGASTITQQLVRNTILYDVLGDEAYMQTYLRKIKEVLITMQVEQTLTKDQILQMYMNEVPLGGVNYGFQAAANAYFGKDVSELTLAESALIAGVIQSPGVYSPLYGTNPDLAVDRQNYVLDQMLKYKDLTGVTEEEIDAARNEELVYEQGVIDIKAPHFVFYVKQLLEEEYGVDRVERGGLKVTTSLDYSLQQIAEEEVIAGVERYNYRNVNNGAMVVMDPNNGQVLAMVGSVDYWNIEDERVDGNVNIAVSERQMGSSVKPFVYLTAVHQGYGPWLETPDLKEISFGTYDPNNWDDKNSGLMLARKALVFSRNVPAVYTLQLVGIDAYLQTVETLGITTLSDKYAYGLSLALGSGEEELLEHAVAYSVLASGGIKYDTTAILKVEDSDGEVLEEVIEDEITGERVVDEKEAYMVNWMLCDLGGFRDRPGLSNYNVNGSYVCGKTGTTDGPKDLVAVLYNSNIVTAVWNGNNNNEEMPGAWATTVPLPIANAFMNRVAELYPTETYNRPSGILSTSVCTDTGAIPQDGVDCDKESTIYISGNSPQLDKRTSYTVCEENDLIPSNLTLAEKYGLTTTKVVLSTTLENSYQQEAYEKYLLDMKKSKYLTSEPDTGICSLPLGENNAPIVAISNPTADASISRGSSVDVVGQVGFEGAISSFRILFDGVDLSGPSMNSDGSFSYSYTVPESTSVGTHKFLVSVTDSQGRDGWKTVSINVTSSSTSVSMASPTSGGSGSLPVSLVASVSGDVDSVTFTITKDSWSTTITDNNSADGWSGSWSSANGAGTYTISVVAAKDGSNISGNSITYTVN